MALFKIIYGEDSTNLKVVYATDFDEVHIRYGYLDLYLVEKVKD